jgi:hypothetical protein
MGVGVQVLSYNMVKDFDVDKKVAKILEIVKKGDVVLIEGRLSADEETVLMSKALRSVSGKFSGVEIAFLENNETKTLVDKLKNKVLKLIAGDRFGLSAIGPSKIIKEIKMNPDKLEILFK